MHRARLVDGRGQGSFAHPAGTRPAELSEQDFLSRKARHDPIAYGLDVLGGVARGNREIFPIRQDMNGDEIDLGRELAVAQPELPYVRVGHRHADLRFHFPDLTGKYRWRHVAAQQDFISDYDGGDHVRELPRKLDGAIDLPAVELGKARKPQPLEHLPTVLARNLRDAVKPVIYGIGAHAIGDLLEPRQVRGNLARIDGNVRPERVLGAAEGSVRDAGDLATIG